MADLPQRQGDEALHSGVKSGVFDIEPEIFLRERTCHRDT